MPPVVFTLMDCTLPPARRVEKSSVGRASGAPGFADVQPPTPPLPSCEVDASARAPVSESSVSVAAPPPCPNVSALPVTRIVQGTAEQGLARLKKRSSSDLAAGVMALDKYRSRVPVLVVNRR